MVDREKYFQDILDGIAKNGWYSIGVNGGENTPPFCYSVGLWEAVKAADLIIFGLPHNMMHSMLWEMFRQLSAGRKLEDGVRWSGLLEGFDCVSRPVHKTQAAKYLLSAAWYKERQTGSGDIAAWQVFWPGSGDGLFPWEAGSDPAVRESQPALYLPRGTH